MSEADWNVQSVGMTADTMSDDAPPSTQQAPGFAACHQLIDTAELLEMVLLEVDDMRTLLLSQRVSRTFKGAIESSPALQMKLWMREDPEWNKDQKKDVFQVNPLLECIGMPWRMQRTQKRNGTGRPFFTLLRKPYRSYFEIGVANNALHKKGNESWRRMLFVRSTRSKIHLDVRALDMYLNTCGGFFCCDNGSTVNQLLDMLGESSSEPAWRNCAIGTAKGRLFSNCPQDCPAR